MAAILFVVITASTRSPFRALVAVIAWAGLFALAVTLVPFVLVVYGAGALSSYLVAQREGADVAWPSAWLLLRGLGAGWLILAAWIGTWPDWRITILFAAIMAAWIATGYHYNVAGQTSPIDIRDEALNEGGKAALALAYLVGAVRPAFRPIGARRSIR